MKRFIKKILAIFSLEITILNKKRNFVKMGLNDSNSQISSDHKTIFLKDFGLEINSDRDEFIIKGLSYLYNLKNQINASFKFQNDIFSISIGDLSYNIQTFEELYILNEVFIEGVYCINTRKEFVLIDIGMNVGITSLFFAQQSHCVAIYAFEPFKLTYEQAIINFDLNVEFSSKIHAFNLGLGKDNKTIVVTYDKTIKGSMGINGIPDYYMTQTKDILEEHIIIKDAAETLKPIISKMNNSGNQLILKMDCEGSEHDIFESLDKANFLSSFSFIVLEWHFKKPDKIYQALQKSGFTFLTFNPASSTAGMIYAFQSK